MQYLHIAVTAVATVEMGKSRKEIFLCLDILC